MDPERWRQVDRVLQGALDFGEAEREAYLEEVCAGDAELRAEVEVLLGFETKAEPFLATPAVELPDVETGEWEMVGRVVGPYRIEALVGEGGMGAVFRARDERLGRLVAIKVVRESGDRGLLLRFTQEARLASSLNHPNIVTVYDLLESDGAPLLVTEYVEGESLRARMRDGMEEGEAIEVARQVASALGAAHRAGVVHRDIKPENVIVRADGLVKVLDFGLAKLVEAKRAHDVGERGNELEIETEEMTAPGTALGTTSYMSPEQARGMAVDARTDVWSLGVMLYEMAAGHRPFRGPTRADVVVAVLNAEPEAASAVSRELREVLDRALRKRADERYATAAEMAEALERLKTKLAGGGAKTDEAAMATAERTDVPTNLPEGRERLIGRERELRAIVDELRETRLLTVTGPGGTGKTRLAAEAGRALLHEFGGGVYFVELAAIRDHALVVSAIAEALGVKEAGGSLEERVAAFLGERELLLVLDNFEQVLGAAPLVARLLEASPRLKALVTSRERLNVKAEREHALSPLALPPTDATDEELERYGSVALFVERARAVRSGFSLAASSEANRGAVVEICRRLDGLPLAIELAAARLRILTPEGLLGRLDRQLKLLTGGAHDLPERQKTMRAAIAWSYDLLDEEDRRLFERLSVFSGGWTLDAAEALAPDLEVLDLLTQLADKSLVVAEERDEKMRYRMLETIRQYAAERLGESGETDGARSAHAALFVGLAEEGASEFERTGSTRCLPQFDREQENLRAALEWSVSDAGAPEITLRLGAAMGVFWWNRGRWSEGRSWLERALAVDTTPTPARARALRWAGVIARWQDDDEQARGRITESYALYCELGDRLCAVEVLCEQAGVFQHLDDLDAAEAMCREGLALCDDEALAHMRGSFLTCLGSLAYDREDFDGSIAFNERALAAYREIGERTPEVAAALYNLAVLHECREEYARVAELLEESLPIAREVAQRPLTARVIQYMGRIAGIRGDYVRAADLRAEAAREYVAIGDRYMIGVLLHNVVDELIARGMTERAARLFGATTHLEKVGQVTKAELPNSVDEEILARLRAELGEEKAEWALASGRGLTLDATLKLAFAE